MLATSKLHSDSPKKERNQVFCLDKQSANYLEHIGPYLEYLLQDVQ